MAIHSTFVNQRCYIWDVIDIRCVRVLVKCDDGGFYISDVLFQALHIALQWLYVSVYAIERERDGKSEY